MPSRSTSRGRSRQRRRTRSGSSKRFDNKLDNLASSIENNTRLTEQIAAAVTNLQQHAKDTDSRAVGFDQRIQRLESLVKDLVENKQKQMQELQEEVEERVQRRANLVVYGIPVTTTNLRDIIIKHCQKSVDNFRPADVVEVVRLGRRQLQQGAARPSPVLVRFATAHVRDAILRNRKAFTAADGTNKLYVDPDLTPRQQARKRALVSTFKALKDTNHRPYWRYDQLFYFPTGSTVPQPHPANYDPSACISTMATDPQPSTSGAR